MPKISRRNARIVIVVIAALMVEAISIIQYQRIRRLMESEESTRSALVLENMCDQVSHKLELVETTMKENLRDVRLGLVEPDSVFNVVFRLIDDNPIVVGGCLAFVPDYYASKGRIFEPYVAKSRDGYHSEQIAGENHDYTENPAYIKVLSDGRPIWSDPYVYGTDPPQSLTTYSCPVMDVKGNIVAVCGLDVDLSWLGDVVNAHQHYPSSFGVLLTEDGKLVTGPPRSRADSTEVSRVVDILNGRGGPMDYRFSAIRRMSMKSAPHWQVAEVYYRDEVYAPLRKLRLQQMGLIILGLLLLLVMIERYARNENKLHQASLEQARISSELAVAARIQGSMLPKTFPEGVFGWLTPAKEVGGDLYDCFVRDGRLFFCIGDVSGKGVPSAMVMSEVHSLFRILADRENSPALIASLLNQEVCKNNETNVFITFFLGILNLKDRTLCYCNAGHDRPVLLQGESVSLLEARANLPIGVFPDFAYEEQTLALPSGASLFLYTDGLTEARSPEGKLYSRDRMMDALAGCKGLAPQLLVEAMRDAVGQFVADAPQSDDLTMLCISNQSL